MSVCRVGYEIEGVLVVYLLGTGGCRASGDPTWCLCAGWAMKLKVFLLCIY